MGYCSAPNCSNKSSDGFRVFRFPREKARRAKWLQNCRRDKWQPTDSSVLCECHFEESQYEQNRQDGRKLLKWNSIPTIFNVPNPPKILKGTRKSPVQRTSPPKRRKIEENDIAEKENVDEPSQNSTIENALQLENAKLKKQVKQLTEKQQAMEEKLDSFLKPDQIQFLKKTSTSNPYKWTNETIRHALQVKCAVGNKGYEFLRQSSYPLPSSRTLSRRIECCQFEPGIQDDIIQWLGIKLRTASEDSKLCVLSLDEMQLRPHVEYDKGLKQYLGFVNKEFCSSDKPAEIATHALVFIVRGLTLHWKQVVAYALTGNSTNPTTLWEFMKRIIEKLHSNDLVVKCVTSDMGSNNRGMWGVLGLHSIRNHVNCKIDHPCDPKEKIYFFADVPHLLKNVRNCLLSQKINLPDEIVEKNSLNTNEVSIEHIEKLIALQEKGGPVLVPNLNRNVVNPTSFEKMRVPVAKQFFSSTVSSALLFCVSVGALHRGAVTTSWFIQEIEKWFSVMSSRHKIDALSTANAEKISVLNGILEWFPMLKFNGRSVWKPIQTGIQLSTLSALQLYDELVSSGKMQYILTSRLSTDCVENFFSQVRETGDSHPTPVKLRHVIRMISIAQYSHSPNSANYDVDDDEYYLDFFSRKKTSTETTLEEPDFAGVSMELDFIEKSGLYYLAGWVVHQLVRVKKNVTCETCVRSISRSEPSSTLPHEWVSILNRGNLIHPSDEIFNVCHHAEVTFQEKRNSYLNARNVINSLLLITMGSCATKISNVSCKHDLTETVISKYLSVRLHILAKDINRNYVNKRLYGSKSAFMRSSAESHF